MPSQELSTSTRIPDLVSSTKSIRFHYRSTPLTNELLMTFRDMVNDAIRICLEEKVRGRLNLRNRIYREFRERYQVVSCYPYSVAEVAWSIIKKHKRWHRRPYAKRLMLKVEALKYSLNHALLSLPFKKGERLLVPLEYGDYQRSFLVDETLKRGSVTVTESEITIAFTKTTQQIEPIKGLGIDLNEKSAVCSDGTRYNLSEVARLHAEYGIRRSQFYISHPSDRRLKEKFAGSRREKERVKQVLHKTAGQIIQSAKQNKQVIVLERLKGIRFAHQRGNGEDRQKAQDCPVAFQAAAGIHRVQGEMGGGTCRTRRS